MKTLRVLSSEHGDLELKFDGTTDTATAEEEARALFDRITKSGGVVLNVKPEGTGPSQRVTKFDELGEESIAIPRIVGG